MNWCIRELLITTELMHFIEVKVLTKQTIFTELIDFYRSKTLQRNNKVLDLPNYTILLREIVLLNYQ